MKEECQDSISERLRKSEMYTQYRNIELEMQSYLDFNPDLFRDKTILLPCNDPEWSNFTIYFAQNFNLFGIKKLISIGYTFESKTGKLVGEDKLPLAYRKQPHFDIEKERTRGKIFTLTQDMKNKDGTIGIKNIKWDYLNEGGDFRSEEVTRLRDESDIVITNPPFFLFDEFISWLIEGNVKFSTIGRMSSVVNNNTFPLVKNNKIWFGPESRIECSRFRVSDDYPVGGNRYITDSAGNRLLGLNSGVRWYTNIEHGRRREKMRLMTMEDNLRYNEKIRQKSEQMYRKLDNYDAIEVSYTDAIPSNYPGVMAVPFTFLDKHNPDQFEILEATKRYGILNSWGNNDYLKENGLHACAVGGKAFPRRIHIRHKSLKFPLSQGWI